MPPQPFTTCVGTSARRSTSGGRLTRLHTALPDGAQAGAAQAGAHSRIPAAPRPGLRATLRRVLAAAWACALVACLSAVSWSFIPPIRGPDEPSHFAYVEQLAETGTLPTSGGFDFSGKELVALEALRAHDIRRDTSTKAIFSQAEQSTLECLSVAICSGPGFDV
jgi:hypothetical protein